MKLLRLGTARRQLHTPASFSDRLTPVAHTCHGAYTLSAWAFRRLYTSTLLTNATLATRRSLSDISPILRIPLHDCREQLGVSIKSSR